MLTKKDIVVFDFDGTLSGLDSNTEFAKYCFHHSVRPWFFLPGLLIGFIGRRIKPDGIWWRQIMRRFLSEKMVQRFAADFIKQHKRERFGWSREQVIAEREAGRIVILISAGTNYLIPKLVRDIPFDAVLTSRMDAHKPWKYEFLCWGPNKVVALDNWAREHKIIPNVVRSYSDSKTDMPIMEIAAEQVWIDRKTGLRKHA